MNRITLYAQLLGALVFCIAASAIADPAQGQIKRVLKAGSGDEAGTLKGHVKWGDIVLKARSFDIEGGRTLSRGEPGKPSTLAFKMNVDWDSIDGRALEAFNKALKAGGSPADGEVVLLGRKASITKALITEIGLPALDGASKEPAYLSVKMQCEVKAAEAAPVELRRGSAPSQPPAPTSQKMWLPSNFRLQIGGLNTSKVARVGPISIRPSKGGSGDPHEVEVILPEKDFRAANLVKWTGPEFDAGKNEFRSRQGKIVLWAMRGQVLATLGFRLTRIGKVRATEGGLVRAMMTFERFEWDRN